MIFTNILNQPFHSTSHRKWSKSGVVLINNFLDKLKLERAILDKLYTLCSHSGKSDHNQSSFLYYKLY